MLNKLCWKAPFRVSSGVWYGGAVALSGTSGCF